MNKKIQIFQLRQISRNYIWYIKFFIQNFMWSTSASKSILHKWPHNVWWRVLCILLSLPPIPVMYSPQKKWLLYAFMWALISLISCLWLLCEVYVGGSNMLVDFWLNVHPWNFDRSLYCDTEHVSHRICHWSFPIISVMLSCLLN